MNQDMIVIQEQKSDPKENPKEDHKTPSCINCKKIAHCFYDICDDCGFCQDCETARENCKECGSTRIVPDMFGGPLLISIKCYKCKEWKDEGEYCSQDCKKYKNHEHCKFCCKYN